MKKLSALLGLLALALYFYDAGDVPEEASVLTPDISVSEAHKPEEKLTAVSSHSEPLNEIEVENSAPEPLLQHIKINLSKLESEGGESSFSQSYKLVAKGLKFSEEEMTYMIEFDHVLSGAMSVILVGDQGETELSSSSLTFDSDSKKLFRGDWVKSDLQGSNLQQIALTAKSQRGKSSSLSLYVQVLGEME